MGDGAIVSASLAATRKQFALFLDQVEQTFPVMRHEVSQWRAQVETVLDHDQQDVLMRRARSVFQKYGGAEGAKALTDGDVKELQSLVGDINMQSSNPSSLLNGLGGLMINVAKSSLAACGTMTSAQPALVDIADSLLLFAGVAPGVADLKKQVALFNNVDRLNSEKAKWDALGLALEGRLSHANRDACLQAWRSSHEMASQALAADACAPEFLAAAVKHSSIELELVWEGLQEMQEASVCKLMEACSEHLVAAQFPMQSAGAETWDHFLGAAHDTWLNYTGGDKCKQECLDLAKAIGALKASYELFDRPLPSGLIDESARTMGQVDALVASVKAVKSLEKNAVSENKLKR